LSLFCYGGQSALAVHCDLCLALPLEQQCQ
jgi:hypothetical protein